MTQHRLNRIECFDSSNAEIVTPGKRMNHYVPVLMNNEAVPLPMQFIAYKYNFVWPLSADSSWLGSIFKQLLIGISLLCYILTIFGEFTFISENLHDIPAISDCLSTSMMGIQYFIRISVLAVRQREMRRLMTRFYRDIYFTGADDAEFLKQIKIITYFANFFTRIYFIPMIMIVVMYGVDIARAGVHSPNKPYVYRMSFRWYDAQEPLAFALTAVYTTWLTISCVGLMSAEDFILCTILCHASFRYKELRKELRLMLPHARVDMKRGATCLHDVFRRRLYNVFRRQQKLHSFIIEAKSHFTYQIFTCMSFGVILLCVVAFQFQSTTIGLMWIKFIVWLISQIAQFIMIGYFGQMLMDETTAMLNSYYMCQWEELLPHGDPCTNKLLMRDINFAIMNSEKAVVFDGMKLFPLTYSTVGAALRSAMSYFMFLNTMNDANKAK